MPKLSSVTAFFPAYHDGGTIPSMILLAFKTLAQITDDYEVVIVNDGSHDDPLDYTGEVLAEMATRYDRLRIITHPQNRGYGSALRSGFANATKDWIFYTDGDAQYDPRELIRLAEAVRDDVDIVNGYKLGRGDTPLRVVIGRIYHYTVKVVFSLPLRDTDCDFRLFRRSLSERVPLESDSGTIALELVKKFHDAGARFVEVPVHHYHRAYGGSQFFNFRRLFRTAVQLTQLWWKLVVRKEHLRPASEPPLPT
jgi:glycosyltransferase involved in cell wall biosynthesis